VPLPAVNQVMTVCKILEGILPTESVRGAPPPDKKLLEYNFVFACVWAFGGCMLVDKVYDYRTQFSKWWISEWKNVQVRETVCGGRSADDERMGLHDYHGPSRAKLVV